MPITADQRETIITLISQGISKSEIATRLGLSLPQVAAVVAHITMGSYSGNPKTPSTNAEVCVRDEQSKSHSAPIERGIPLGTDLDTQQTVRWNPFAPSGAANPHMLIVGQSGSGKTYATQCLITELVAQGVPSLVFDYGRGFDRAIASDAFADSANLRELDLSRNGISLNPLSILPFDIHGPINVAQRLADSFQRIYPKIGVQQHALLRDVVLAAFKRCGIDSKSEETWKEPPPTFESIDEELSYLETDMQDARRNLAALTRSHISTAFVFSVFRRGGYVIDWTTICDTAAAFVLTFRGLPESTQKVATELLLWNLLGHVESRGPDGLNLMIILDEAHRLSFAAESPVERLLREGRKFGVGVILASQQLGDFSSTALANTATKLIFRLHESSTKPMRLFHHNASEMLSPQRAFAQLSQLATGTCIAVLNNSQVCIRINPLESRT